MKYQSSYTKWHEYTTTHVAEKNSNALFFVILIPLCPFKLYITIAI